ncbi:MAG: DUF1365 family protein [Oceanospirillaceae bacterium]|jgi:DUF1365 family protein
MLLHNKAQQMHNAQTHSQTAHHKTIKPALKSAFYIGHVFHKRFFPKEHEFTYPLYMNFLDLDEVSLLNSKYWWFSSQRWAPLQIKISDYFRNEPLNIDESLSDTGHMLKARAIAIAGSLGANVSTINRVCVLAQLRCFGIYFSPINFFFLYENVTARYLIAEVSNTPWNNSHCYLIDLISPAPTEKAFHVSPFMDLDMEYRWRVKEPTSSTNIHIESWRGHHLFTASFSATRYDINTKKITAVFLRWPIVSVSIVRAIYWQALKLFLKRIRYVPYQIKKSESPTLSIRKSTTKSKS